MRELGSPILWPGRWTEGWGCARTLLNSNTGLRDYTVCADEQSHSYVITNPPQVVASSFLDAWCLVHEQCMGNKTQIVRRVL